jgi:predicted GIY-YIG superfamily endonuclease
MLEPIIVYPALYILKCENEKWYVGISLNLNVRLGQHWNGTGALWTRLHKPIEVHDVIYPATNENEKTLELMSKYGYENVRGGKYCKLEIDNPFHEV